MTLNQTENIVSVELFSNMVNSLERRLKSEILNHDIKYNPEEANASMLMDFNQIKEVLQKTIDSFYLGYYEVSGFQFITLKNIEDSVSHNLGLVNNAKKLIKFIN